LADLINRSSGETNKRITKWQSDTEGAVSKLLRPARMLTLEQRKTIAGVLKSWGSAEVAIRHTEGNDECQQYADQVAEALKDADWKINPRPRFLIQQHETRGLWIMVHDAKNIPPAADKLWSALSAAGIKVQGSGVDAVQEGTIEIMVGLPE
jgi:hypothetical protein